jgi:hypothetical protein
MIEYQIGILECMECLHQYINVVEVDVNKCVAVGLYRIIDDLHVVTGFCDWIQKLSACLAYFRDPEDRGLSKHKRQIVYTPECKCVR